MRILVHTAGVYSAVFLCFMQPFQLFSDLSDKNSTCSALGRGDSMIDKHIIQLFFERSEDAIRITAETYGRYLYTIAYRILFDCEESE